MQQLIDNHRETALDSPYSRDRRDAIEELGGVYPDADGEGQARIAETLRQVACESPHQDDRDLARETLRECFDAQPASIEGIVVDTVTHLAESSKFSDERLAAIDLLRDIYPDLSESNQETVGRTLAEIAGNGTYEDERDRARQRLSDVTRLNSEGATTGTTIGGTNVGAGQEGASAESTGPAPVAYLGQSLAEHLERAARESSTECRQRAEEVQDFLAEYPLDDEAYDEVREEVSDLVDALRVLDSDGGLAEDRVARIEQISARLERLYRRTTSK